MKLLKLLLPVFIAATLAAPVRADEASKRAAATELIKLTANTNAFRRAIQTSFEPMLQQAKDNGASDAAIQDLVLAINDWLDKDFNWDELRGQMVEIYAREFTEPEINQVLAFYKTPVGQKTLAKLPTLMSESAHMGQAYASARQASLVARFDAIKKKYNLQ